MSERILPYVFLSLYTMFCVLATINIWFIVGALAILGCYIISLWYIIEPY